MTFLSKAIKKHIVHKGNKILFKNNLSLNRFALLMWEELNYRGVDGSVLSRVIKGERLFTQAQLDVLCNLLNLKTQERENLDHALYLDNLSRYNIRPFSSFRDYDVVDLLESLLNKAREHRLRGRNEDQGSIAEMVRFSIEKTLGYIKNNSLRKKMLEQLGEAILLKGHALGGSGLPATIIKEAMSNVDKLFAITKEIKDPRYEAYGNMLLAGAYYVAGNYSYSAKTKALYLRSIIKARKAYEVLPNTDHERLSL